MATIREAKNGKWQAIVKRKNYPIQSKTHAKKSVVEEWARAVEVEMDRGVYVDRSEAETTSLFAALERYEEDISKAKDGYAQEKYRIAFWKASALSKRPLANLRASDFVKIKNERLKVAEPSTVQKDFAVLSNLFNIARTEWDIPVQNPLADFKIPSVDNSRERRLAKKNGDEESEEERIYKELTPTPGRGQTRSVWMIPLVKLAIETAARQSELLAITWADVDFNKPAIRIYGKVRADGKRRTKGSRNGVRVKYRDVPMSPRAKKLLEDMKSKQQNPPPTDRVLPVSSAVVKNAFAGAVKRAGITDLTFHDLRHEATSRLADIYQIHELMKITGHGSTRMLARYYHPDVEDLAKKLWTAQGLENA